MSSKIICPICDEELGNSVAEIPEKCPICDTRKYEILQELKEQGEFKEATETTAPKITAPVVTRSEADKTGEKNTSKTPPKQVIVEEEIPENEGVIFNDLASGADATVVSESEPAPALHSDSTPVIKSEETSDVVFGEEPQAVDVVFDNEKNDATAAGQEASPANTSPDTRPDSAEKPMAAKPAVNEKYRKSGASDLETFPVGFKYCPTCQQIHARTMAQDNCPACSQHSALQVHEQGFPPGNYLVLYNDKRKAISYFRLDNAGSVIIGRSSERNSANDIDLTAVWKNYYEKNCPNPEELKEKMRLLKGVSSKHALVRYVTSEKKYVLFHLTDKNFTVVQLPNGEKRERSAQNKTRVELLPNSLITLGDQQNFIVLRFKTVSLAQPNP